MGTRLQASVVLSCPGLRLDPLYPDRPTALRPTVTGLDAELTSVKQRLTPLIDRRRSEAERRRRKVSRELKEEGRWVDDEEVRSRLVGRQLIPGPGEFNPTTPLDVEEGLELLPLYYDARRGPVALAEALGGWETLEVSPEGGSRPIGLAVPPEHAPDLDGRAESLLTGYLRYWLARDTFLAAVQLEMLSTRTENVIDAVLDDLHAIASDVLARGAVRAKLAGEDGLRLTAADIDRGIRATDQDWLDRPTWGSRL